MKFTLESARLQSSRHVGPACIACGNTRVFAVRSPIGDRIAELQELSEGEHNVVACGRCGSRHSILITNVD